MTEKEKREKLANELMMLAEAILQDNSVGKYNSAKNELKVESNLGGESSIHITIKNFKAFGLDIYISEEWPEFINE